MGESEEILHQEIKKKTPIRSFLEKFPKWKEGIFLTSVAGMSMIFGFGATVSTSKKQDPDGFDKGLTPSRKFESGTALATRALKWGTFYAVTGCGIIFFAIWKIIGATDLKEFRQKVGNFLPRVPRNEPEGRTEFANLTELFQFVIDEDKRAKAEKQKTGQTLGNNSTSNSNSENPKIVVVSDLSSNNKNSDVKSYI